MVHEAREKWHRRRVQIEKCVVLRRKHSRDNRDIGMNRTLHKYQDRIVYVMYTLNDWHSLYQKINNERMKSFKWQERLTWFMPFVCDHLIVARGIGYRNETFELELPTDRCRIELRNRIDVFACMWKTKVIILRIQRENWAKLGNFQRRVSCGQYQSQRDLWENVLLYDNRSEFLE